MAVNRCDYCHEPITFRETACLCYGEPEEDEAMYLCENTYCIRCHVHLGPDDGDGICFECDEIVNGPDDDDDAADSDLDSGDDFQVVDPSKEPTTTEPTVADPPGVPVGVRR